MGVPKAFAQAFAAFQDGTYARQLDEIESVFYSPARQMDKPGLRFRRDIPPFLGAGKLQSGAEAAEDVVVTFGVNPKRHRERDCPRSVEEYYQKALTAFDSAVPSAHHKRYVDFLESFLGTQWRATWQEHHATMDTVPWYSDRWAVGTMTRKQVELIRPHLTTCRELLRSMKVRLAVFNGAHWVRLLTLDPPVFVSRFQELDRVEYASVTGKKHKGAVLLGEIRLTERTVPALVMTCFIHKTRPQLSGSDLCKLGETLRSRLNGQWIGAQT
jgi:hypothetical protein